MPLFVAAAAVAVVTDAVVVGFIVTFIKKRSNIRMRSVYIKGRAHVFRNLHIDESSEDSIPFCHASIHAYTYIYIDCTTLTAPLIHLYKCIGAARAHTDVRIHTWICIYIYIFIHCSNVLMGTSVHALKVYAYESSPGD